MKTLVLNANFIPLNLIPLSTISWQDAVCLIYKDKATAIENYEDDIHSQHMTMKVPSVIVLREYKYFKKFAKYSKYNVKLRDGFRCQYCGDMHTAKKLTVDHVNPKRNKGKLTWENSATACKKCNAEKRDKLYSPLKRPIKPTYYALAKKLLEHERITNEHWAQYVDNVYNK